MLSIRFKIVILIFVIDLFGYVISRRNHLIVELPDGKIQGRLLKTPQDVSYLAFQDIPYGSPPVGNLRFKDPVPPKKWDGVLKTTENTKICYQFGGNPVMVNSSKENEDCLNLNVYTPVKPCNSKPVLVYIFGGGFIYGNSTFESYGPDFWIEYGIVVVTINYRLGPLGFLSTQDSVIPGNQGLKDQNLALKWIHDNIYLFGGDPKKITISGQSAGGVAVGHQLLSKKSKGLFSGAIFQSGTPLCSWAYQKNAKQIAYQFASAIDPNFDTNSTSAELLELLQAVPAEQMKSTPFSPLTGLQFGRGQPWVPVLEDPENENSFFTERIHESIRKGNFNKVPILIGVTSEEAINFASDPTSFKSRMANYDNNISLAVNADFYVNATDLHAAGNELRKIYTDGQFQDNLGASISFYSDATMTTPSSRHADLQSKFTDVYFYQFSYAGELGDNQYQTEGAGRVQHTAELNYLWRKARNSDLSIFPKEDLLTQTRLLKLWTNFINCGNPTPEEDSLLENVIWPKVAPGTFAYLNINNTLEVKVDPKRYKKWKAIVDTYGNPPFDTY